MSRPSCRGLSLPRAPNRKASSLRGAAVGAAPAAPRRRDLLPRQRPSVRCEQAAARRRVVAGRASWILLGEEHRFGGRGRRAPAAGENGGRQACSEPSAQSSCAADFVAHAHAQIAGRRDVERLQAQRERRLHANRAVAPPQLRLDRDRAFYPVQRQHSRERCLVASGIRRERDGQCDAGQGGVAELLATGYLEIILPQVGVAQFDAGVEGNEVDPEYARIGRVRPGSAQGPENRRRGGVEAAADGETAADPYVPGVRRQTSSAPAGRAPIGSSVVSRSVAAAAAIEATLRGTLLTVGYRLSCSGHRR